jgi:hypothetical protein
MRIAIAVVVLVAAAACASVISPEAPGVHFSTAETAYNPGETVVLRLTNAGDETYVYNICYHSTFERVRGSIGVPVELGMPDCPAVMQKLDPGETAELSVPLPETTAPGRYRVRTRLWPFGSLPERHRGLVAETPVFTMAAEH